MAAAAGYNETGAGPRPRLSHGRPAGATSATVAGMTFGRSFPAALRLPWGMFTHLDHSRLLRFAGLFTWAVVGLPLLLLSLPVEQGDDLVVAAALGRSEEHTSELQSLMRISYAVFCLKKKTQLYITEI